MQKLLLEKNGVPMVINSYVDNIKKFFHTNGLKDVNHTFTFGLKENFPLKAINLNFEVSVRPGIKKIYFNGGFNPDSFVFNDSGMIAEILINGNVPSLSVDENEWMTEFASTLTHEMTHVFENYHRIKKTKIGLAGAANSSESRMASDLFTNTHLPNSLREFLFCMYSAASFEVSARTAQVYPILKGIKDPKVRIAKVKETMPWEVANQLSNFNMEKFQDNFSNEVMINCMIEHKTPKEIFDNLINELEIILSDYKKENINQILNSLTLPQNESQKVEQAMKIVSSHAEKVLKKQPYSFFNYWIKIINKAGEKAKKKILKVAYNQDF